MDIRKKLFRRQFVLGPRFIDSLLGWNHVKITDRFFLTVHPDLEITQVHNNKNKNFIILLGYMLDPYNPSYGNLQIIQTITDNAKSADDIFSNVANKCGRFVIIVRVNDEFRIFSDPGGLRQVFYSIDQSNNLWCASQPALIAEILRLNVDENIINDLNKSALFSKVRDYCWFPGNITIFKEIFHLSPNNYLDLNNGKIIRYWPRKTLTPVSINECVDKISIILPGIIKSASERFKNLAFSISSGLDSRVLLAASKDYGTNIKYFTHARSATDYDNPDVRITSDLLKKLGLKHNILVDPLKFDDDFEIFLRRNVTYARRKTGLNAFSIFNNFKDMSNDLVVIYGNASEITKRDRYRWPDVLNLLITGPALTEMAGMSHSKVALDAISSWFDSVKGLTKFGVNILDLMHWEHRVGNWLAMTCSEYDIAFETLCPYTSREYIEYMLRVQYKYRTMPDYKLHHEIIRNLWPEILGFEITSINRVKNKFKKAFIDFLYRTYLYDYLKYAYIMLIRRFK